MEGIGGLKNVCMYRSRGVVHTNELVRNRKTSLYQLANLCVRCVIPRSVHTNLGLPHCKGRQHYHIGILIVS